MLRWRGEQSANAALRQGENSAQFSSQIGNIIGQAGQTIGREMREGPERERARVEHEEAARVRKLQADEAEASAEARKKAAQQSDTIGQLMATNMVDGPDGIRTFNRPQVQEGLTRAGMASRWPDVQAAMDKADTSALTLRELRAKLKKGTDEALGDLAWGVHKAGDTLGAFQWGVAHAIANETITREGAQQFIDAAESDPAKIPEITRLLIGQSERHRALLEKERPADYTIGNQRFSGETNALLATAERPKVESKPGDEADFIERAAREQGRPVASFNTRELGRLRSEYAAQTRAPKEPSADNEPLVPIMGPDERPVLVRRSQAEGKRPASNREQGRAVTTGSAEHIEELDTSLDDIAVLRKTLQETATSTGTGAKIGASMPNWATDLLGWGTEPKKRQGVIDRVKQVIGKALEGGVLRKEDEAKYEKILPTIADTQEVAASKLDGLERALLQRRSRAIESLTDAGYETSKFIERTPAGGAMTTAPPRTDAPPTTAGPKDGDRQPIPNHPGQEAEYRNGRWVRVK